ncbi:MAG: succinate dehydrogenase assembly factor 2 [Brachymonas sp.]|nr:succinate dehydrogenase assembly factor 2 [Brachymonas sp.]
MSQDALLSPQALSRLRWRCRRGLLENELIIHRWLDAHAGRITVGQAEALSALLELPDNDLLDLLLRRATPDKALDTPAVRMLLAEMQRPAEMA